LFFALQPHARVRARLAALAATHALPGERVVVAPDLHLTLVFLGSVAEPGLLALQELAAGVVAAPVDVKLTTIERWQGGVLCATGAAGAALIALQRELQQHVGSAGFQVDERIFRPHVTLARGRHGAAPPAVQPIELLSWRVRSFCLMASARREDGGRYTVIGRWRLKGAT
jgi:2'-5' RNA ligase